MRRRIRRSRSVGAAVALTLLALAMLASSTFPLGGIGGPYNAPSPTRFESLAHASGTGIVSVGVTPAAATLAAGANLTFAPDPVCSPSPCPAGVVYSWSLTRPLGQLDYSTSNANGERLARMGLSPGAVSLSGAGEARWRTQAPLWERNPPMDGGAIPCRREALGGSR